jgi:hypothetical protein
MGIKKNPAVNAGLVNLQPFFYGRFLYAAHEKRQYKDWKPLHWFNEKK